MSTLVLSTVELNRHDIPLQKAHIMCRMVNVKK